MLNAEKLSKFPFEDKVDKLINNARHKMSSTRFSKSLQHRLDSAYRHIPKVPQVDIPTPFGAVRLESIKPLPEPVLPDVGKREKDIIKSAIAKDVVTPVSWIPIVGDYLAEEVESLFEARLLNLMTPDEYRTFVKYSKINPSDTVAAIRALISSKRE